ncbi:MAG: Rrf2 family transcriptional regulator [Coriobacteriia bacterium]|nr:Rrf2 family transcriptional regulator [Coriobacteriia bacterium]
MKISTKGLYAVRLMLFLAGHVEDGLIPLKRVSEATLLSKKYLEQITPSLSVAGLIKSVRGASGGYKLARPAEEITFLDIIVATEGAIAPASCLETEEIDCNFPKLCSELPVWIGLKDVIEEYLSGVTLQGVLEQQRANAAELMGL